VANDKEVGVCKKEWNNLTMNEADLSLASYISYRAVSEALQHIGLGIHGGVVAVRDAY
jgi:hypothetical protein